MTLLISIGRVVERLFVRCRSAWTTETSGRLRAGSLVVVLLASILLIELDRLTLLPSSIGDVLPEVNHLAAISWSVTLLLIYEIFELILSLEKSVAASIAAHLEVFSLILIHDAFKLLSEFGEPISVTDQWRPMLVMSADAIGAIALFVIANVFRRMQRHSRITRDDSTQRSFVALKRLLALVLFLVLIGLLVGDLLRGFRGEFGMRTFDLFFTTLVFVDVLLAMLSLAFTQSHPVVFRNFAFAFVAVMLRLALASDEFYRPAIGVVAGLVALAVTFAYNDALRPVQALRPEHDHGSDDAEGDQQP